MNLNIITPVGYTGYGVAGLNIVKGLTKLGHKVSLFLMGSPSIETQEDKTIIEQCLANAKYFDYNAPCIRIWHQFSMEMFVGQGKHIGFPFFELDRLNNLELHHLGYCDKVFVASEWAKEIVVRDLYNHFKWPDTQSRVKVVPLGVDRTFFNESPPLYKMLPPADKPFVFLNCGKWEIRKSHDLLVYAFNEAFSLEDNVELWMLPHNPFLSAHQTKEWEDMYMKSKMGKAGKIRIHPRLANSYEVSELMKKADCGVFPTRSEGWNLEGLEMLSCGKPVIMTNYSAQTEYMGEYDKEENEKGSSSCWPSCVSPIMIEGMEPAFDGKWFFGKDGEWSKPSVKWLVSHMKGAIEKSKSNTFMKHVKDDAIEIAKKFSWENTCKKLVESI